MQAKVFPIDNEAGYDGCGLAMAAIQNGRVVKIAYLRDITDYDGEDEPIDWLNYRDDLKCKNKAHELETIGIVSVGIASCWEFIEL